MDEQINFNKEKSRYISADNNQYKSIRKYALILLVVLLVINVAAYFTFRLLEINEMRWELADYYKNGSYKNQEIYPGGIVMLKNIGGEKKEGYYEQKINDQEYLIYNPTGTDLIFAKSEREMAPELSRMAIIIAVLYLAELILFFGWWKYIKDKFEELFITQ
jgi:hypothetical protein